MATKIHKGWTDAEDRILIAGYAHFTTTMLAEDLGRTRDAIHARIRKLRACGWDIRAMPPGRGRSKLAEQARAKTKPLELSLAAEREALRDEIAKYLKSEISAKRIDDRQLPDLIDRIKTKVLSAPQHRLKRYLAMPIERVVRDAA